MTLRCTASGELDIRFSVPDAPSLVLRRLALLRQSSLQSDVSINEFSATFPPDAGHSSGGGAIVSVEVSGSAHRSSVRARIQPLPSTDEPSAPPREGSRSELRAALDEMLAERRDMKKRGPRLASMDRGVCYWALSTLTILGLGEVFLLRLRDSGLRAPLFERWTPRRSAGRYAAGILAAAGLVGALLLVTGLF